MVRRSGLRRRLPAALAPWASALATEAKPIELDELPNIDGIVVSEKLAAMLAANDVGNRSDLRAVVVEQWLSTVTVLRTRRRLLVSWRAIGLPAITLKTVLARTSRASGASTERGMRRCVRLSSACVVSDGGQ